MTNEGNTWCLERSERDIYDDKNDDDVDYDDVDDDDDNDEDDDDDEDELVFLQRYSNDRWLVDGIAEEFPIISRDPNGLQRFWCHVTRRMTIELWSHVI